MKRQVGLTRFLEVQMSFRRWILPVAALLVAACSDGNAPLAPRPEAQGPHFLRWSSTAPLFEAIGVDAQGAGFLGGGTPLFDISGGSAPIAVDQTANVSAQGTWTALPITVGTGANRLLMVGVSIRNGGTAVTGVTYAGRTLSFLGARTNSDNSVRVEMWYLVAPPSGSSVVSVMLSGSVKMVVGAVSFTGVDPVAPVGTFASVGSTTNSTNPSVALGSSVGDGLGVSVVSLEGSAGTIAPVSGQSGQWTRFYGTSGGDAAGGGSTAAGATTTTMGWTKTGKARWAIGAVVVRRAPILAPAVATYEASFWAVRGQSRSVQINYLSAGVSTPFMSFTATDPTYVPGRGNLAVGDSVFITVRVDSQMVAMTFQPAGLLFGTPAQLKVWYGGVGGDLNGDGLVNATDAYIESQLLGMWYQDNVSSPWTPLPATHSVTERWFAGDIYHFSRYAVSW